MHAQIIQKKTSGLPHPCTIKSFTVNRDQINPQRIKLSPNCAANLDSSSPTPFVEAHQHRLPYSFRAKQTSPQKSNRKHPRPAPRAPPPAPFMTRAELRPRTQMPQSAPPSPPEPTHRPRLPYTSTLSDWKICSPWRGSIHAQRFPATHTPSCPVVPSWLIPPRRPSTS